MLREALRAMSSKIRQSLTDVSKSAGVYGYGNPVTFKPRLPRKRSLFFPGLSQEDSTKGRKPCTVRNLIYLTFFIFGANIVSC